ncbi:hypothetical protein CC2G_014893 [Coprinopsis cinerea AmutBmut pab1-1]|nr:hypothetical protein CC2G_014893 [Coprinopsis cinerea AmutBmut pab1-1]
MPPTPRMQTTPVSRPIPDLSAETHQERVIGSLKSVIHNPRDSEEAKNSARDRLRQMGVDPDHIPLPPVIARVRLRLFESKRRGGRAKSTKTVLRGDIRLLSKILT